VIAAVGLPIVVGEAASGRSDHAVVHDLVPVFAGHDAHEEQHCVGRGAEIGVAAKVVSGLDAAEEDDASERVDEHHEDHAHNDEETLEEGVGDSEHKHF